MNYRYATFVAILLMLGGGSLSGCSQSNSETPSVQILIDTLNGYSKNHEGIYEFSDIKKLDGQILPDGLTYNMDYQATITANECFGLRRIGYSKYIAFTGAIDKDLSKSDCTPREDGSGFTGYADLTVVFRSGFQKQFQAKAVFTKKESGWQVQDIKLENKMFR